MSDLDVDTTPAMDGAQPGGEPGRPAPTTTISTISVHSGDTKLVIALLQSRELLQLKVLEVQPDLTKLGANVQEAIELQRAHDEVLVQLQSKQSPVEELLRQADQLISTQKPRAEVYAAMAESLGLAWRDVNSHLEQRKSVLDANVSYQSRAEDCRDKMRALDMACQDDSLPVEIETVKGLLTQLHDLRRVMLEALMNALQDGKLLLEKLKEIAQKGTLDSRPDKIKTSATYAVSQVEHWLEELHDRRRVLEILWQTRKTKLEQCLALALLASDLHDLEDYLSARKEGLSRSNDQLGDSSASAEILLHEHRKLVPEAKDLQDRGLKITRATEQLVAAGHFAGEEATAKAYSVLSSCAEYIDAIEQRELLLSRAITFFRSAHTSLTKLDQLEVQLTTTELAASSPQRAQLHLQITKAVEEVTTPALQEGYLLLDTVGRGTPGSEGVKRTVELIENRKINLGELCSTHREENVRLSQAYTAFLEKQNELFSWLVSTAEAFLQGHQDMGSVLAIAEDFLAVHHKLFVGLQKKGSEINELLLTLPPILEDMDDEQRTDVDHKVDGLHSQWLNLKSLLETRVDLATDYVRFHTLAVQLANGFDLLENELKSSEGIKEESIRDTEQKWLAIQQLFTQLSNTGKHFIEAANKVGDPYLDIKRATLCVETLLEHFGSRQLVVSDSWQTWQTNITVEREFVVLWERNMTESSRTVDWVSKLDGQLYPVLIGEAKTAKTIARDLEEKLQVVVPEVKRAQAEIELRVKTAENLSQRGDTQGQKETIVGQLMELHNKLQVIITDYQILLQMLISFFKNLAELEKTIENLESQYRITRLPNVVAEIELLLKEHEASHQAVLELFKFTQNERDQIIARIRQQEPEVAAKHDIDRLIYLLESKQSTWEAAWSDRKLVIEQHRQLCQFDSDLHQINSTISDLSRQLSAIRGQYGESLTSAKATSVAFVYFEKTIALLEVRIQSFVSNAEQMLSGEHNSSPHIESELNQLQSRWTAFHKQVIESRRLIDLSIQYFILVEEAEEWFKEGSKLLVTIARKSTTVRLPEEATQLLNEVEYFLKPGEIQQDERIKKISNLAIELYGEEKSKQVTLVLNENREMLDSFTVISEELNILARNLKAAEDEREKLKKEQEEADASLAAARAEAAAAKAAAAAAEEARRAAEAAAKALRAAVPVIEKVEIEVVKAVPLPPSEPEKPSPPPSPQKEKPKFIEELPKPSAPMFTVPLSDATIQEGERFTFECRVTGFPMPNVVWHKDGIPIQSNPDYLTTFDQGICTLTIEETFTEDSAKFTCRASNSAGTAETNAVLFVKESEPSMSPPIFTKQLESASAKEGSIFQLECKVEGNPLPTVQWFKNDACVDNSPDYVITYNNGEAILRFEEVFLEDQAEYSCKASNPVGTDICKAKLSVEPLEPTEVPCFVIPLSNVMARAGQKIKLECQVTGQPLPQLTWSHNGKPIKETRDIKMQHDDKKATLVVAEAFPKDAGVYIASAKNIAGEATSSCNVSVKGRLPTETSDSELASDLEPVKPSIQLALKDVSVFEGKRVRLDCVIVGQPEPEVIWYHNGRPVKESTDFKLLFQGDRCSLVIQEVYLEDAGEYKVVAINSAGEASSICSLSVKSVGEAEPATRSQAVEISQQPVGVPPKFSKLLTDVLARETDQVVFECCVSGDPKPDIKWLLNNKEIYSVDGIEFAEDVEGNVSLTILEVTPENKGVYTVKAINSCGEAKCFANLIVKPSSTSENQRQTIQQEEILLAPAFKELFADRTVNEKEATKFECIVTGKPTPKVQWLFNGEPVSGKDFLTSVSGERQVLAILEVSKIHSGKVACEAENEAGKATCVATLTVKEVPVDVTVVPSMENQSVSEQRESSFVMKRSVFVQSSTSHVTSSSSVSSGGGEPNIQVHSYSSEAQQSVQQVGEKPPVQVQSKKVEEFHQFNHDNPVIKQQTFLTVTNGTDDNPDSETSNYSTPVASPRPVRKSVAPRFMSPLNGKIVDQGSDVVLEGILDGYPSPAVSWQKNGQDLSPKEGCILIDWELNKARLELKNVGIKDAGRYTCKATNSVGSASSTADVVVKKTIFPPVFGHRLQAQVVKVGERVVMEVEVTGMPDPTVTWFKDGQQILGAIRGGKFRTKIQGNSYSLIIEKASLDYSGKYTVKAVNAGGEAQSIADFLVVEPHPDESSVTEVVIQNVIHTSTQKRDHEETTSVKVSPMQQQPTTATEKPPEVSEKSTPKAPAPEPYITESMSIKEMTKTEKQFSIKMERTQSPACGCPESQKDESSTIPAGKTQIEPEVQVPVVEEIIIPVRVEERKKEVARTVEIPIKIIEEKTHTEDRGKTEEINTVQTVLQSNEEKTAKLPEQIKESKSNTEEDETGVESESITKQSALDFFISKLKESDDDTQKSRTGADSILEDVRNTSKLTELKSHFESLQMKEDNELQPNRASIGRIPIPESFTDREHMEFVNVGQEPCSTIIKREENISYSEKEFHIDTYTKNVETVFGTNPNEKALIFRTEPESSSSMLERSIIHYPPPKLGELSSLEPFNLQPEPPPEMGYIPKTDVPAKLRLDMTSRVKKLEESHRVLSPVEIPSGGVRIFPAPIRSESQTSEKVETKKLPTQPLQQVHKQEPPKSFCWPCNEPEPKKEVKEEPVVQKEVVEELAVETRIIKPGSWTYPRVSEPPKLESLAAQAVPSVPVVIKPWTPGHAAQTIPQPKVETLGRPLSPKPSVEGVAMEKLWSSRHTPEPETFQQPAEPIVRSVSPKPPPTDLFRPITPKPSDEGVTMQRMWSSSHIKTSVSDMSTILESGRCASPRPSSQGLAMEKLWTPHKPSNSESVPRPMSAGPYHFVKDMSPKPSQDGLAMDRIWAHKHPDSSLKRTWPPPQVSEEKSVIPWSVKDNKQSVAQVEKCEEKVHQIETDFQKVTISPQISKPAPSPVQIFNDRSTHIPTSFIEIKREAAASSGTFPNATTTILPPSSIPPVQPEGPPPVKHYIAETRVSQSSSVQETQILHTEMTTTTENVEMHSEHSEISQHDSMYQIEKPKVPSPPVVEERTLKPSEAKKLWPPQNNDDFELKAPAPVKDSHPRKDPPSRPLSLVDVASQLILEPGPPPELGFAPPPPIERRQSYVETIEQDLEKNLEKEPSKHIVGAIRIIPPPPQKDHSIPPPLPSKEKAVPPPLPPKLSPQPPPEVKQAPSKPTKGSIISPPPSKPFEPFPNLEPFPFKPDLQKPKMAKCPPPPKPSKFRKGEFGGSDYESDLESSNIQLKWRPYESDTEDLVSYKRVVPPSVKQQTKRPSSTDPEPLPPSKFEQPAKFDGPPRPAIDTTQIIRKESKMQVTKATSKMETKGEKVKKHHTTEQRKRYSPPSLKPGSPPIFVQTAQPASPPKQEEPNTSPVKVLPDSPKFKSKIIRNHAESGYMADTDEPRHLKETTQKSTSIQHEESRTTIEHSTHITQKFSHESSQTLQQQQKTVSSEKPVPSKIHPTKTYHKHLDHKTEKKATVASSATSAKPKKELVAPALVREVPVTSEDRPPSLEPFLFSPDSNRTITKRSMGPPPPSPSKFVKGEFRESDYESDYEGRIPPRWRPVDVNAGDASYRPVRHLFTPGGSRVNSRASVEARSPTPPTEFDNPPQFGGPPRPKFEPIDKPKPVVKLPEKMKTTERPQKVFKPKPITPKSPPIEVIVATPAVKEDKFNLKPGSPPELAFAPPPGQGFTKIPGFENATQMETSNVMNFAESTETSRRVVSVQQTTRVIKFGEKETKVESLSHKPEAERPRRRSGPPPTTPKRFVPGEFRESDYESDYDSHIRPKWTPGGSDTDEPHYRKVKPQLITRSTSVPAKSPGRVPTPMEFDTQPPVITSSTSSVTKTEVKSSQVTSVELEVEQKRLRRVEEMRKRFGDGSPAAAGLSLGSQRIPGQSVGVQEVVLKPGAPPEFGFAPGRMPAEASYVASKHMNEMTNTFKSRAQQFVDEIMTDVRTSKQNAKPEKVILKSSKDSPTADNDPQAYREESRVAEFGTKHIDPDTGLIYFKYDFGYEFGVILPGEGNKQGEGDKNVKRARIEPKRDDDIDVPVIHEISGTRPEIKDNIGKKDGSKAPPFRPKKFSHFKSVKWEPVSESEMSEAEGDSSQQHKKRYSLPQPSVLLQNEPHILIPPSSRWDQASPSPMSLSPSLPSLSPGYGALGPRSGTPGQESAASPGGSWQGHSPNKGPRGRGNTPTPPSTPSSTPSSNAGIVSAPSNQPKKAPVFITPLRDIAVVSGQTARFECIVQAEPPPNILWSKNGRIIENSQNHQIQYRNGVCRLTIPQAFPEDASNYTCTATNLLGSVGTSGSLQVPGERRSLHKF